MLRLLAQPPEGGLPMWLMAWLIGIITAPYQLVRGWLRSLGQNTSTKEDHRD